MKPGTGKTYKYVWTARNFIKFEEKMRKLHTLNI